MFHGQCFLGNIHLTNDNIAPVNSGLRVTASYFQTLPTIEKLSTWKCCENAIGNIHILLIVSFSVTQ